MTDEADNELEEGSGEFYPDTLDYSQVYFHPDVGTLSEKYGWEAVVVDDAGCIWGYPPDGPPVRFEDRNKGKKARLMSVN